MNKECNKCKVGNYCHYKQFINKEQEYKELKKKIKNISKDYIEIFYDYQKYKQALEDIRDIADENKDTAQYRGICNSILEKVNEAIGAEKEDV